MKALSATSATGGVTTLLLVRCASAPGARARRGITVDSLPPRPVGRLMFPIAQACVQGVALVSDESIVEAQQSLWERLRVLPEPGGAAAFAALLSRSYQLQPGERVGIVVCSGNISAVELKTH